MADSQINPETGETSGSRSPRFTLWVAFFAFAVITLGSSIQEKNHPEQENIVKPGAQKWAIACSAITFSLSFIMVVAQLHPVSSMFVVGTKLEGIICIILLAFWAATVAVVTDAANGLAVDEEGAVDNGNLYYFSWAGLVCAVMLSVAYLRSVFGVDVADHLKNRSVRLSPWSGFLASTFIVLGSCANVLKDRCKPPAETIEYCRRTKYGLAIGATGGFFALGMVGLKIMTTAAPFVIEGIISFVLAVLFGFGVALLTSTGMPGAPLGNLYYFSWISFLLSLILFANCIEEYKNSGSSAYSEGSEEKAPNGEIQVESIDDTI